MALCKMVVIADCLVEAQGSVGPDLGMSITWVLHLEPESFVNILTSVRSLAQLG